MEPNEFSKNYLLIATPHERQFKYVPCKDPPDIKNQIAVGMAVSSHLETILVVNFIGKETNFDTLQP